MLKISHIISDTRCYPTYNDKAISVGLGMPVRKASIQQTSQDNNLCIPKIAQK